MKKVLVHGYFRANLGDDLFFRALAMRYPKVRFYIPTTRNDYKKMYLDLPNVKVIDFMKISALTSKKVYMLPKIYSRVNMSKFDAVVCIGGSLFIDRQNPSTKDRIEAENYSFICDWEYAKKAGVPYFVLGANWGPCYNKYFFDYFSKAFDSLTDLYFRDTASFEAFSEKPSARVGGDILMGNTLIIDYLNKMPHKKQLSVSVIDPAAKNGSDIDPESYYKTLASLCNSYLEKDYDVKLLSFCKDEGDEKACFEVLKYVKSPAKISTVFYRGNWKEILQTIGESELMIASRFHATVLGWTLNVPVFSIAYSNKTINLMQDCGVIDSCVSIENISSVSAEIVREKAVLPENISAFSGADAAFEKLDKLLE